jgi:hypothetical protein
MYSDPEMLEPGSTLELSRIYDSTEISNVQQFYKDSSDHPLPMSHGGTHVKGGTHCLGG